MTPIRKRSDDLLLACGWKAVRPGKPFPCWTSPDGVIPDVAPHPYADAQGAVDLAEAMGLRVVETGYNTAKCKYAALLHRVSDDERPANRPYWQGPHMPTIAEAISTAILAAVTEG